MKYIKEYKKSSINHRLFQIGEKCVQSFLKDQQWLWDYYIGAACEVECFIGLREKEEDAEAYLAETYLTAALYFTASGFLRGHGNGYGELMDLDIPEGKLSNSDLFISVKIMTEYRSELSENIDFKNNKVFEDSIKSAKRRIEIAKKFKEIYDSDDNVLTFYNMQHDSFELMGSFHIDLSDTSKIMVDLNK